MPASVPESVYQTIQTDKICLPDDSRTCVCEIAQLAGPELRACQNDTSVDGGQAGAGFCYVDVENGLGVPLASGCTIGFKFVGLDSSFKSIVVCEGAVQ